MLVASRTDIGSDDMFSTYPSIRKPKAHCLACVFDICRHPRLMTETRVKYVPRKSAGACIAAIEFATRDVPETALLTTPNEIRPRTRMLIVVLSRPHALIQPLDTYKRDGHEWVLDLSWTYWGPLMDVSRDTRCIVWPCCALIQTGIVRRCIRYRFADIKLRVERKSFNASFTVFEYPGHHMRIACMFESEPNRTIVATTW